MKFGDRVVKPDVRRLDDMREVIYDKEWLSNAKDINLYYMYRDLYKNEHDRDLLISHDLRYDITIIPPFMLGSEYVKTMGHYHPQVPSTEVTYPLLYEVLEGEAVYLMQREDYKDVVSIGASTGDKVLIPPGYGHITINASNRCLKMANFVARSFSSIYGIMKEMGGAAYFLTENGYIPNKKYSPIPPRKDIHAPGNDVLADFGLKKGREMYSLVKKPDILKYLTSPQDYLDLFEIALS